MKFIVGLIASLESSELPLWNSRYNLAVVYLGGNDLARESADTVWDRLKVFTERVRSITTTVAICNAEERLYSKTNHFHINPSEYNARVMTLNTRIRRYCTCRKHCGIHHIPMNAIGYRAGRTSDHVHFDTHIRGVFLN